MGKKKQKMSFWFYRGGCRIDKNDPKVLICEHPILIHFEKEIKCREERKGTMPVMVCYVEI